MIFWMRYGQARYQLGTPEGAILGGAQSFLNYAQHIFQGDKFF